MPAEYRQRQRLSRRRLYVGTAASVLLMAVAFVCARCSGVEW